MSRGSHARRARRGAAPPLLLATLLVAGAGVLALGLWLGRSTIDIRVVSGPRIEGGDADRGERAIDGYGCGACHVIPGVTGATGRVGPSLEDVAERTYIAGNLTNTPENLIRWIRQPQQIEPGTAMPDLGVSEDDARNIAAYLYALR